MHDREQLPVTNSQQLSKIRIFLSKNTFPFYYRGFQNTALAKYSVDFEDSIQWPPGSPQFRRDIALRLWEFDISQTLLPFTSIDLEAYIRYQTQQADLFMHDSSQYVLIRTHQHISDITEILKENLDRSQAQEKMCSRPLVNASGLGIGAKRGARLLNRLLKRTPVYKSEVGYEQNLKIL
jgi:hypothetical protein